MAIKRVWAVVADIDGVECFIRQAKILKLKYNPVVHKKHNYQGKFIGYWARPRRFASKAEAEKCARQCNRFEGVSDARVVNLIFDRNDLPYNRHRIKDDKKVYKTKRALLKEFNQSVVGKARVCPDCEQWTDFPYKETPRDNIMLVEIYCHNCGKQARLMRYWRDW